jgi:hypothetical protein
VDRDGVIIIDGLTKNFRVGVYMLVKMSNRTNHDFFYQLPGWRIAYIVAPKSVISAMQSAGSFLEGRSGGLLKTVFKKYLF